MAKIITFNKFSTETWVLDEAKHYVLGKNGVLDVDAEGVEGFGHGIYTDGGSDGMVVDVLGRILVSLPNHTGIFMQDTNMTVRVGASGLIKGDSGITVNAVGTRIENAGAIRGGTDGVEYYSGVTDLVNAEGGLIRGAVGVRVSDEGGTIVNHGRIIGENMSVYNSSSVPLELINTGHLGGNVVFGGGKDLFVNRGGTVDGVVEGRGGDDVFRILSGKVVIDEVVGQGQDRVQTKVSYVLADGASIEFVLALGKNDIKLTGNDEKNQVIGNRGDNILSGLGGDDLVSGGLGNDNLTGGDGEDVFSFIKGHGKDVITDFETQVDRINLEHYDGVDGVDDLTMIQKGDNVVIKLHDGDRIVLLNEDGVFIADLLF